jgi:hypothetical protein
MNSPHHESPFTLAEYRSLLRFAKERYSFCDFHDFDCDGKIIWRHDLEYSLQQMDVLARIDAEEGVPSIVFVQLRSPFYNALSAYARGLFRDWSAGGVRLGLHFDWEFFADDLEHIEDHLAAEKRRLEDLVGAEVRSFSYHNPNPMILKYDAHMAGMLNAYNPAYFQVDGVRYISDSNGRWRDRNLRQVLSDESIRKMQVNLHDTWWCEERVPQIAKIESAFRAEAEWKIKFYRDHAGIIVDWII